ncbi:MAG: hypothetical protein ABI455_03470 [Candidatus Dormiibacterota bacterium]
MRISAFSAISVSRRWRMRDVSHERTYSSRASSESCRNGRACRLAIDARLKAVSITFRVRRVPGAQRSR